MPDPRTILADITAELMERGVQPRPLAILAHTADRRVNEAMLEALASLLAETKATA
jgi:hypothetical protein